MKGITFGAGMFVAVGDQGVIIYTTDGTRWDYANPGWVSSIVPKKDALRASKGIDADGPYNINSTVTFNSVAYGGGLFVAVGADYEMNTGVIRYSSNGTTWSEGKGALDLTNIELLNVSYVNGEFLIGGGNTSTYDPVIITGTPSSWLTPTIGGGMEGWRVYGAAENAEGSVIVGAEAAFLTWTEGSWSTLDPWLSNYVYSYNHLYGVAFGMGKFVAVGDGDDGEAVILSSGTPVTDDSWASQDLPFQYYWVTDPGEGYPQMTSYSNPLYGIAYGPSGFVAVGEYGAILTSSNGATWDTQRWDVNVSFNAVAWGTINGETLYGIACYGGDWTGPFF
jgi:hypothetical protein